MRFLQLTQVPRVRVRHASWGPTPRAVNPRTIQPPEKRLAFVFRLSKCLPLTPALKYHTFPTSEPPPDLSVLSTIFFFGRSFWSSDLEKKKKTQIYGKGSWKISHRHIFTAALWTCGRERAPRIRPEFVPAPGSQPLPSLSIWQTRSSFHLPPHPPLPPPLFTFSIPLSHFLILFDCPTPSHSYPLTDHLSVGACTDGLFPRAAGLNQLQFEMKAGGGGGVRLAGRAEI